MRLEITTRVKFEYYPAGSGDHGQIPRKKVTYQEYTLKGACSGWIVGRLERGHGDSCLH